MVTGLLHTPDSKWSLNGAVFPRTQNAFDKNSISFLVQPCRHIAYFICGEFAGCKLCRKYSGSVFVSFDFNKLFCHLFFAGHFIDLIQVADI